MSKKFRNQTLSRQKGESPMHAGIPPIESEEALAVLGVGTPSESNPPLGLQELDNKITSMRPHVQSNPNDRTNARVLIDTLRKRRFLTDPADGDTRFALGIEIVRIRQSHLGIPPEGFRSLLPGLEGEMEPRWVEREQFDVVSAMPSNGRSPRENLSTAPGFLTPPEYITR